MPVDPYPDEAAELFASYDAIPRIVSRAEALAFGISARAIFRAVESGRWTRLLPRTYFTGVVLNEQDRWRAAVTYAGDGSALSGAAALRQAGANRVRATARLLVLVPPGRRVRSGSFVHVRETSRAYRISRAPGVPHVEAARACADLALELRRLDDVRAVLATVVQDGLASVSEVAAELAAGPRGGSALLRQAVDEIALGAASAPEAGAATILRRAGIAGFEQNVPLVLPDGSRRVIDLYWERLRACLEIDSLEYHFRRADWEATMERDLDLTKFGYSVIHRPPSALKKPQKFVNDVSTWLRTRETELRGGVLIDQQPVRYPMR